MRFAPTISLVALGAKAQLVNKDPWEHHVRASAAGVAQFNAVSGDGFELRLEGKPDGKPAHAVEATFNQAGAMLTDADGIATVGAASAPLTLKLGVAPRRRRM